MQLIEGGHSYVEVERMMRSNGTPVTTRYIEKVVAKELAAARTRQP